MKKMKATHLVQEMKEMCKAMPKEQHKVRMLVIYMNNYKLKNNTDFKGLCSMFNQSEYGQGVQVLETVLKLTQADEDGNLYSEAVAADKFGRITPYMTSEQIQAYQYRQAEVRDQHQTLQMQPLLLTLIQESLAGALSESSFPFFGPSAPKENQFDGQARRQSKGFGILATARGFATNRSQAPTEEESRRIVFVIGGLTHQEVQAVNQYERRQIIED